MSLEKTFINYVCRSLSNGKSVNRRLPEGGKLFIDKPLPYLCVYRYADKEDTYLSGLLKTQGAYLVARQDLEIDELLFCIAATASHAFHAFMIIELWMAPENGIETFKIYAPEDRSPATIKALKEGFEDIEAVYNPLKVQVLNTVQRHPPGLTPLLSLERAKEVGTLQVGIEIPLIYQDEKGNLYALLYRKVRRKISQVLKKAAFEFIRVQTSNQFGHYLTLGKTQLTQMIRSADRQLAEVSEKMSFLLRVSPVNQSVEFENFRKHHYSRLPEFNYRLISLDPEEEKRRLFNLQLENIEDPTLAFLFRDKRMELEKQLLMLEERESKNFLHLSNSLYGEVEKDIIQIAKELLEEVSAEESEERERMQAEEFKQLALNELGQYRPHFPDVELGVEIRKDINGIMVSKSRLLIGEDFSLEGARAEALLQHEVGTHILTYGNGKHQPFKLFYAGMAGYDPLQEGLAVLAEYLVGGLTAARLRILAIRVLAVESVCDGADFIETYRMLNQDYGFAEKSAFNISTRVHRGGGLTKDAAYLKGLVKLMEYMKKGGEVEPLYAGKFALAHVPFVKELIHRRVVKTPFLPPYINSEQAKSRLEEVRRGISITKLINHEDSIRH
ncbi:uncharacterized protein (TIGR02421 family) [Catalinimonas alkaloidigena]|uniref:flavohemoglobin expression-modulating QEGLA motif protein n=1 Tax=Catalinimonas alkaloidigena TaxID=1075417 RepID=UPI002406C8F1|nr:tyrosine/phenylalanine carboxypeptidase domain-containing protein [Catalinimonas alkaloidigena]MDF9798210.1 uncharacterized protein (TIGR02421 family) [Catalinimonas alkaloidigena]